MSENHLSRFFIIHRKAVYGVKCLLSHKGMENVISLGSFPTKSKPIVIPDYSEKVVNSYDFT